MSLKLYTHGAWTILKVARHNYDQKTKTKGKHNNITAVGPMVLIARYVYGLRIHVFLLFTECDCN